MLLFLGVAWATAGLYVVHAQIPRNVLELPLERVLKPAIPFFAPEGWAFFTRDPREPHLLPYRHGTDGMWAFAHAGPHADIRTMLALATAATLITSSTETLFRPALGFPGVPACVGAGRLSFFCLIPRADLALAQAIAAAILLVVASGWRPRLTGVPHWWISYSFAVSATIPAGGDQVTQILALLLVPVTLTDPRGWPWQSAPQTARPIASLVAWSALFVARLQVAGIYFDSSLAKLATPVWAAGTALSYWSTDPAFGTPWWMRELIEPVITSSLAVAF